MIFRQLYDQESSTYTYLLADEETGEGVLIDPVKGNEDRDLTLAGELGVVIRYVLETHVHADHVTGAGEIRRRTGAKTVLGAASGVKCADILLGDGDTLRFGSHEVKALSTPGHTDGCTSYLVGDRVFTGDTLLIRGTGRTDFQQGSAERLYGSIRDKLFRLPDATFVYPGHDYKGRTVSTIGEEKKWNPRVAEEVDRDTFLGIMRALKLPDPKKIHEAVPANLNCGSA